MNESERIGNSIKHNIKIVSFPRSGSHYLCRLIQTNFLESKKSYNDIILGHHFASNIKLDNEISYIYLYRNFADTAKSLYSLGKEIWKFSNYFMKTIPKGISFDEFLRFPCEVCIGEKTKVIPLHKVWDYHVEGWKIKPRLSNVLVITYDELVSNFNNSMLKISNYFGHPKKENFINTNERCGISSTSNLTLEFLKKKIKIGKDSSFYLV